MSGRDDVQSSVLVLQSAGVVLYDPVNLHTMGVVTYLALSVVSEWRPVASSAVCGQ